MVQTKSCAGKSAERYHTAKQHTILNITISAQLPGLMSEVYENKKCTGQPALAGTDG